MFANLRFLQLDTEIVESKNEFKLEILNEFVRLEKLYLNTVVISRSRTLRLPELKVLSLKLESYNEYRGGPSTRESTTGASSNERLQGEDAARGSTHFACDKAPAVRSPSEHLFLDASNETGKGIEVAQEPPSSIHRTYRGAPRCLSSFRASARAVSALWMA